MIQTNTVWDTRNAALAKQPIYVLEIGGEDRVYTTGDLTKLSVTNRPADWKPWLKTPRGSSQTVDVLRGTSTIGELECEVVDQAGAVRTLVGGEVLEGRSATLKAGYPEMDYSEFVVMQAYQLYKITPSRDYTSWMFRARDRQLSGKKTIYVHPENGYAIEEGNPWFIQGTPAEIFQAIWLFGLERSDSELDRAALVTLDAASEGLYKTVRPFFFTITEPLEAKQFLETEIFKPCGCYPVVLNTGKLSLRGMRAPASGPASIFTFDEDNCVGLPGVDRMAIINEILFKIDYAGEHKNVLLYIDGTSLSTYGRAQQYVVESRGLRTNYGAAWWCQEVSRRLFTRFAGTPLGLRGGAPIYTVEAFLLTQPVWVGDYVNLTGSLIPNLTSGALGITDRLMEVVDREPDYARGRMRYKLLDTGLTGQEGAYLYAASGRNFVIGTSPIY